MKGCLIALIGALALVLIRGQPSPAQVRDALTRAMEINEIRRGVELLKRSQSSNVSSAPTCAHMLRKAHGKRKVKNLQDTSVADDKHLATTLLINEGFSLRELQESSVVTEEFTKRLVCSPTVNPSDCDPSAPYRTPDGSCNNLANPTFGMAGSVQRRELQPTYADGVGSPRAFSVTGTNVHLPNPRTVSNRVHRGAPANGTTLTLHTFQFGQLLDHDLIDTPLSDVEGCCTDDSQSECFPIKVERDDNRFSEGYCMDVARSAATSADCTAGIRNQGNAITSFIDASNVYGSSLRLQTQLRNGGFMKTAEGDRPPDNTDDNACRLTNVDHKCSFAGDHRVNVVPSLTSYHTLFIREHNRIATFLQDSFSDPKILFEETRRIVIAIMQKITYDEYLPAFMSDTALNLYGLRSGRQPDGSEYQYNAEIDPTTSAEFGIAYRFGHTWISRDMSIFRRNLRPLIREPTEDTYHNPALTYVEGENGDPGGIEGLAFWLSGANSPPTDRIIESAARDFLFKDSNGDSFDLAALNIHRGRDHGVPTYTQYRSSCGLSAVTEFNDVENVGLVDHDLDTIVRLARAYDDPQDIDLFTGVVTEKHVSGGGIGPTLECVLGRQFKALKYGDRFWYEGIEEGTGAGFTKEQILEIQKTSIARLLCDNMKFREVHREAFKATSESNPIVSCDEIGGMDLSKFVTASPRPDRPPGQQGGSGRPRQLADIMSRILEELEQKDHN